MNQVESRKPTYATLLTPVTPAAISVVELQGPDAEAIVASFWMPATQAPRSVNRIRYGRWSHILRDPTGQPPSPNEAVRGASESIEGDGPAEDVVLCWTNDDTVEIHCHGGKLAAERILEGVTRRGAVQRSTAAKRMAHGTDPYVTAAWIDIENATTETCLAIMLDQARGALSVAINKIRSCLRNKDWDQAEVQIQDLLNRGTIGLHLTHPWRIAIVGPPNSGKSRLLNAILGYDRAIVDVTAGTTRDVLDEPISLLGWPFIISDTAGLRDAEDPIEKEGVSRAIGVSKRADLVLLLVEPRQGWMLQHAECLAVRPKATIIVHSKKDLGLPVPNTPTDIPAISISAQTGEGLTDLYERMVRTLIDYDPEAGEAYPFRSEHLDELRELLHLARNREQLALD